jgi:hypothetical protein
VSETLRELTCLKHQAKEILRSLEPGVYEMNSAARLLAQRKAHIEPLGETNPAAARRIK